MKYYLIYQLRNVSFITQSCLVEIVNAILYELKTGCQWEYLPVESLFSGKVLKYGAITNGVRKANGNPFGFTCWTDTVMYLTCQV